MDQDTLQNYIDQIVSDVVFITDKYQERFQDNSELETAFSSLNNYIGNIKHYIHELNTAMNGNDKFLLAKTAIKEIDGAKEALELLFRREYIDETEYRALQEKIINLDYLLRSDIDSDYA